MPDLAALVGNPGDLPDAGRDWCAIVGANPTAGARSPSLWNAAFGALGSTTRMVPLDVTAADLGDVLALLDADRDYLGGAIAVPHKAGVATWLGGRVTPSALRTGAVNALHRGDDGHLRGANTDGEAALLCLRAAVDIAGAHVVVLGAGGVAAAVVASITAEEPTARVTVVARDPAKAAVMSTIGAAVESWQVLGDVLSSARAVVHCTPVGSRASGTAGCSPVDAGAIARLPDGAVVYDLVYDPAPTRLLEMAADQGLAVLDGLRMNLEQAVLAFVKVDHRDPVVVRSAMQAV